MSSVTVATLDKARCTGCFACANKCPVDAIAMKPDAEGFPVPVIDKDICIVCGECFRCCPVSSPISTAGTNDLEAYAAWSLDEELRYESTSGGVFSELALEWLGRGGVLCAAQYGKGHKVEHVVVDSASDLVRIRQSKYAQSDVGTCFCQIKSLLDDGREVFFCGTPCQCAGLKSFLGETRQEGLFVASFVCRGVNSPKAYAAFLKWLEGQYTSSVSRVWFKNKVCGWNCFSTRVEFEDGQVYSEDRYHDLFIRGYIEQNLYMRECCHSCEFRETGNTADIVLADFWGVKLKDESLDTDLGTSLVIVNTKRGGNLFESIKPRLFWERKAIEDAFPGNVCISESPKPNPKRSYFLSRLDCVPFDELCRECFDEPSLARRMARLMKQKTQSILKI